MQPEKKPSRRVQYTCDALRTALIELLLQKPIKNITVKDVCARADIKHRPGISERLPNMTGDARVGLTVRRVLPPDRCVVHIAGTAVLKSCHGSKRASRIHNLYASIGPQYQPDHPSSGT